MYSPDEIQNIRAEMNRDAAPAAEEVAEERRKYLREHGCDADGCEVNDPDALQIEARLTHNCPAFQREKPSTYPVCDEHTHDDLDAAWAERFQSDADMYDQPVVAFDCRITVPAERPEEDALMQQHGKTARKPRAPVKCPGCGAEVDAVYYPEETDG